MRTYNYKTIHLPTKRVCLNEGVRCASLKEFYDKLVKWNESNPDVWLYVPIGDTP